MFHHTYDNIEDIEPEFVASLELLLKDRSPSFEFIKENEKEDQKSTYYLFFGNTDNTPKAFLKSKLETTKRSLINKIIPSTQKDVIKWCGPKTYSDTFMIDPKFKNEFANYFKEVATAKSKELKLKKHKLLSPIPIFKEVPTSKKYLKSLFKSKVNYEDYIKSLSSSSQKEVTQLFKEHRSLEIKTYNTFQECFNYKEKSKEEYIRLKKLPPYNLLTHSNHSVIALENNNQIIAFITLIKNDKKHSFFHSNNLLELVDNNILTQLAIMLFYEDTSLLYLHSLNKLEFNQNYEQLNFDSYLEKEYSI